MTYTFEMVERVAVQVAGVRVQTDMMNAQQDCPVLWQQYYSCLDELGEQQKNRGARESYGVSVMQNGEQFVYWAANEYTLQDVLPVDFRVMTLPGGLYVRCKVPTLAEVGAAFTEMYMQWPQTQEQYALDMRAPCFEVYGAQWTEQDSVMLYALTVPKTV